jgi:hypothetical protein
MGKRKKSKGIIKQILQDHFAGFWDLHADLLPKNLQNDIKETVEKSIRCGTRDMGYAKYECLGCPSDPDPVFVCFTCKSRFCHRCGKKYTDEWTEKQVECILDVPHRHLVFTIPEELRDYFFHDRKRLNQLSDRVANVIKYHYKNISKKRQLEVGVITVIHTFGRDLKWNPHVHALITEGAIDKHKEWNPVSYIPYEYLRKSWQKLLCDLLQEWYPCDQETKHLINDLYRRYNNGFYVNAETKMKDAKGAAKYIGRYLARPAIAEYRIVEYDGKNVHYWYEDHRTGKRIDRKVSVFRFIYYLLQHIPPKHFRMVQRFGLYCRQKNKQSQKVIHIWNYFRTRQLQMLLTKKKKKLTYRQRMIEHFDKDPIECPHCKQTMELTEIWHADYGWVYHYLEEYWRDQDQQWGMSRYEQKTG